MLIYTLDFSSSWKPETYIWNFRPPWGNYLLLTLLFITHFGIWLNETFVMTKNIVKILLANCLTLLFNYPFKTITTLLFTMTINIISYILRTYSTTSKSISPLLANLVYLWTSIMDRMSTKEILEQLSQLQQWKRHKILYNLFKLEKKIHLTLKSNIINVFCDKKTGKLYRF